MYYVFGLGNPGPEYSGTRHNVGFMTVEKMAALRDVKFRKRCLRPFMTALLGSSPDILVKPLTYMNASGTVIPLVMKNEGTLIVVCDQMDLPPGRVRIRKTGGSAGHNGLKSIIANYPGDFIHVYIGIGRPGEDSTVVDHVLSTFTEEERVLVDNAVERAADALLEILDGGDIDRIIQRVNTVA